MSLPSEETQNLLPQRVGESWQNHIFFFWFSVVCGIATLVSLILAVYFYQASKIAPILTFAVHPLKTELQRPDQDKEFGFIYKGQPVDSASITSVQVAVWNAGTRSIRDTDILDPFRLVIPDGSAILNTRVKKISRPICGFESIDNPEDFKSGKCALKWRILEPGDGAVLQVIYAGGAGTDPQLDGTVEGQSDGVIVEKYSIFDQTTKAPVRYSLARIVTLVVLMGFLIVFIVSIKTIQSRKEAARRLAEAQSAANKHLSELRKKVRLTVVESLLIACACVCLIAIFGLGVYGASVAGPPFGW